MFSFVPQDSTLNKAFRLACFIHGNKHIALKVLNASLERLETAVAAQDKRLYYTPSIKHLPGRDRPNGYRYKVSFSESHLLQRLIYLVSEPFEIQQELRDSPPYIDEEDMIIHFLKHLVHITMRRNSFYVALGISRVLHNYTTGETIDIYNVIGQPDRMSDDDYYRSRKRQLLREIKQRFGSYVDVYQGPRAEEKLIVQDCSDRKAQFVQRCLELLVPWDSCCLIPATLTSENVAHFYSRPQDPYEEHGIEVDRFHVLIHPDCYNRLTHWLGLDPPCSRLQIPSFFLSKSDNGSDGKPPSIRDHLPSLDELDLIAIKQQIEERATRRKAAARGLLRVRADGIECAQLDLRRSNFARICLQDDTKIIEVVTDDPRGELILASHLLTFDEEGGKIEPPKHSIVLEGGQKLSFAVSRSIGPEDRSLTIDIAYQETGSVRAVLLFSIRCWQKSLDLFRQLWRHSSIPLTPTLVCALSLAIAISSYLKLSPEHKETRGQLAPSTEGTPDEQPPADTQKRSEIGGLKQSPKPGVVQRRSNSGVQGERIARKPPPEASHEAATEFEPARAPQPEADSASLLEARRICVQTLHRSELNQRVNTLLTRSLLATNRFTVTDTAGADAELKVSVRQIRSSGNSAAEQRVRISLRLVDADGRVIWPVAGARRNYSGLAEEVAAKAINDLTRDIQRLRSSRK